MLPPTTLQTDSQYTQHSPPNQTHPDTRQRQTPPQNPTGPTQDQNIFIKNNLRIAHLNIQSTGHLLTKPQTIIDFFARRKTDIICLTEIKISKTNQNFYHHKDYHTTLNLPLDPLNNSPKEGIAILIHKDIHNHKTTITNQTPGKVSKIQTDINNEEYTFYCLYAPSQSDLVSNNFFSNLLQDPPQTINTIFIGDFNTVLDPNIDRKDPSKPYHKPKTSKTINDYILDNALVDPWRTTHPNKKEFSWKNYKSASRIDYALLPAHLYHQVTESEYLTPPIKTDHKALTLNLNFKKFKTGRGYSKVKNTLYTHPDFNEKIRNMITDTLESHNDCNPETTLDLILFNTSTIAQEHTRELRDRQNNTLNFLNIEIKTIEAQLDSTLHTHPMTASQTNHHNKLLNKLEKYKTELKSTQTEIYNETYLAELEANLTNTHKPSKEFKKPTPRNSNKISEIYIDNQDPPTLSKDQDTVHNKIFNFYNNLFQYHECNNEFSALQDFMKDIETGKITTEQNSELEKPFTKQEIADFVKTMSNDKAPGLTGITPTFYKVFWNQIGDLVTLAVNNCLQNNSFPPKQKIGLVTLIPKPDKDPKHIENHRPITLLSTFYKISSGVLTQRLKPILDSLIQPWQKAYLPGRYIGDITRNTFDIFQHAKDNNLPGLMLQIDFSKAFDSISYQFIENTLKLFNLSPKYIHWINSLLKNFQSSILINGFPTPRIQVGRGCRQGDPIAGYLFIICIELLLLKMRNSKTLKPWETKSGAKKLIDAYADDINIFLKFLNPSQQLSKVLEILTQFQKLSGLTTNVSKTKYALFGHAQNDPLIQTQTGFSIEPNPFRLLGVYMTGNLDQLELNWKKAINAVRTEIGMWSTVKLSTTAKVNITKICLLSKFTHFASILPLPNKQIRNEVERIIVRFINGPRSKLMKNIIFSPTTAGGLGVPPLETHWSALQCSWLKRMHNSAEIWKKILISNDMDPVFFLATPPPCDWNVRVWQHFLGPSTRKMVKTFFTQNPRKIPNITYKHSQYSPNMCPNF